VEQHVTRHLRWLPRLDTFTESTIVSTEDKYLERRRVRTCFQKCANNCDEQCVCRRKRRSCTADCHRSGFLQDEDITCSYLAHVFSSSTREYRLTNGKEDWCIIDPTDVEDTYDPIFSWKMTAGFDGQPLAADESAPFSFKVLIGDPNSAAIFRRQDQSAHQAPNFDHVDKLSTLQGFLDQDYIDKTLLSDHLNGLAPIKGWRGNDHGHRVPTNAVGRPYNETLPDDRDNLQERYFESLTAIVAAKKLYDKMDRASIDLGITLKPLCMATWFPGRHVFNEEEFLSRPRAFSCISHFETGSLSLLPSSLENVLAISSGNSIYVAASLCKDPWPNSSFTDGIVQRYTGNVGRAGLSLLVPPAVPRIRSFDPGTWKHINHDDFDGKMTDSFQSTSLHLSFTEYELPVDTGSHGSRDGQAFFLESLVSACDRGDWVADLDILGTRNLCFRLRPCTSRLHDKTLEYNQTQGSLLTSIDSWMELLDPPSNDCIVRSDGNWCGRLATATVSLQRGYTTLLLPQGAPPCWTCVREWLKSYREQQEFDENDDEQGGEQETEGEILDNEGETLDEEDENYKEKVLTENPGSFFKGVMIIA